MIKTIKLSNSEIVILELFLSNPSEVYSTLNIFSSINNYEYEKEFSINSVKSSIKRLRNKLPRDCIANIYGQGYKLNLPI